MGLSDDKVTSKDKVKQFITSKLSNIQPSLSSDSEALQQLKKVTGSDEIILSSLVESFNGGIEEIIVPKSDNLIDTKGSNLSDVITSLRKSADSSFKMDKRKVQKKESNSSAMSFDDIEVVRMMTQQSTFSETKPKKRNTDFILDKGRPKMTRNLSSVRSSEDSVNAYTKIIAQLNKQVSFEGKSQVICALEEDRIEVAKRIYNESRGELMSFLSVEGDMDVLRIFSVGTDGEVEKEKLKQRAEKDNVKDLKKPIPKNPKESKEDFNYIKEKKSASFDE